MSQGLQKSEAGFRLSGNLLRCSADALRVVLRKHLECHFEKIFTNWLFGAPVESLNRANCAKTIPVPGIFIGPRSETRVRRADAKCAHLPRAGGHFVRNRTRFVRIRSGAEVITLSDVGVATRHTPLGLTRAEKTHKATRRRLWYRRLSRSETGNSWLGNELRRSHKIHGELAQHWRMGCTLVR